MDNEVKKSNDKNKSKSEPVVVTGNKVRKMKRKTIVRSAIDISKVNKGSK